MIIFCPRPSKVARFRYLLPSVITGGLAILSAGCGGGDTEARLTITGETRTIDGSGNNLAHPAWGAADVPMQRMTSADYADGVDQPAGTGRASARVISNGVAASPGPISNSLGLTDMFWQWGQFLDHDLDLTPVVELVDPFDVPVPKCDPWFDPFCTGLEGILLDRSFYEIVDGVREQINEITSYIDASNVYGSDEVRAAALRTLDGTGMLRTSAGGLPPFNTDGLPNAPSESPGFFLAGDFRSNEQVALTAMHALFVREHNYWAGEVRAGNSGFDGETIYQQARAIVAAEMQWITFNEFLPLLLGANAIPPYTGYDPTVDATIMNCFATAAYRFGHTMLSSELLRLDANLNPISRGNISLLDAFFEPDELSGVGLAPYLRGLSTQVAQEIDNFIVDDVRNFLFGPPGSGGLDLASLNIQRGRDHGLPSYNQTRIDIGLPAAATFADISSNAAVQTRLSSVYASVDDVDLWVGGLAEDHVPGAAVGETFWTIIRAQFIALRDGDRFWYENYLTPPWQATVESQSLAGIIRRNTAIGDEIPDRVMCDCQPIPASASAQ